MNLIFLISFNISDSSKGWVGLSCDPSPWIARSHQRPQGMCSGARHGANLQVEVSTAYQLSQRNLCEPLLSATCLSWSPPWSPPPSWLLCFCLAFLLGMLQLHGSLALGSSGGPRALCTEPLDLKVTADWALGPGQGWGKCLLSTSHVLHQGQKQYEVEAKGEESSMLSLNI